MKITVRNLKNEKVKDLELPEAVFGYPYKEHLIHTVVRAIRAARRSGTHQTKTRAEVSGSGRKLWRQKGTGRARIGGLRSPLWRKGGVVHGPRTRSHALGVSVREKKNALKSALSRKLQEDGLMVVDSLELRSHKTGGLAQSLRTLGVEKRALLVDWESNEQLRLASRNNPAVKAVDAQAVNVYDVVDRPTVVLSETALNRLVEVLTR